MFNKKTQRVVAAVIAGFLALVMIITTIVGALL